MANSKPPFHPLDEILGRFLKGRKWEAKLKQYSLHTRWAEIVGPKIAIQATPTIWRGNTLFVEVSHPAWLTELRMIESDILEKIRSHCEGIAIEKIHWILRPAVSHK